MAFHEIRFPVNISLGSIGGPERLTEVVTLANGFEERNTPWVNSRRHYQAGFGVQSMDDIQTLVSFFESRRGRMHGFRWKDWSDYKSCLPSRTPSHIDQFIGVGDGENTKFQLRKIYSSGEQSYTRIINKIVFGSTLVAIEGVEKLEGQEFRVDINTGVVEFVIPPDIGVRITAGFEFDVPVRFDTDEIMVSVTSFQAGEPPEVPIIEVRV